LRALVRLAGERGVERSGEQPREEKEKSKEKSHRPPEEVLFVGDSTARQQTVSLCCMLVAGTAAAGAGHRVVITKAIPFMDFRCRVNAPSGRAIALISFSRFMRADALPTWRPVERHPRLSPVLAAAINRAPTLLIINLGAWEFEDGCQDMHSLHDGLCNVTRPWILREYAAKWMLVAAAVRTAYFERTPARADNALVVWRAATPRDFEGGVAKSGGRCRRREPLRPNYVANLERELDPMSMRFAVLSKNLILDAVAAQRIPWVRVLDAYAIARTRADAHPGPDPKTNPHGRTDSLRLFDDCLHYCLPGVPDVFNGRLLRILEQTAAEAEARRATGGGAEGGGAGTAGAAETSAEAAVLSMGGDSAAASAVIEGAPGALLARWNFRFGGGQFVQGTLPNLQLQLQRGGPPTPLECPLTPPGVPAGSRAATSIAAATAAGSGALSGVLGSPLLGFCSDFDPPAVLRHYGRDGGLPAGAHASLRARRILAGLAAKAAAARRANRAELLGKAKGGASRVDASSSAYSSASKMIQTGAKAGSRAVIRASDKAGVAPSKEEWDAAG
jgi:hypothetical protein